uniref:Uncharacterized protein n=1 Tax=Manihot esculenta TaxID=3983 RepID=A0A2C9UKL8_MANES
MKLWVRFHTMNRVPYFETCNLVSYSINPELLVTSRISPSASKFGKRSPT